MQNEIPKLSLLNCEWLPLEKLRGTTIFITGATGLIGFNLISELLSIQDEYNLSLFALVRNIDKAKKKFSNFLDRVCLIQGDVTQKVEVKFPIDYIIHGASVTSSNAFVETPVETIMTSVMGTRNMLELARNKNVRSMVYLSSMEVYGTPTDDSILTTSDVGYLNPLNLRSSYPESKRMCESLCVAYAKEYNVPVKIARLAQTFGPGMQPDDKRAVVQFISSAMKNKNIEIKASGESSRMYLYTFDSVSALITLLLKGENAQAYNIANKDTYCSIRTLAETIVKVIGSSSRVLVNTGTEEERSIYPPDSFLRLDVENLENLGWHPIISLNNSILLLKNSLI